MPQSRPRTERGKTLTRLAFFGSPALAATTLEALIGAGHEIGIVISNPDRRRSRRGEPEPSPVKAVALAHGLSVSDRPADVIETHCTLGVVVAYGQLIRPNVLERLPMVNVHFSLLPRWRGAAPVECAILAGDEVTGVCLMGLEEGLDTGPVFARAVTPIGTNEHAEELRSRLGTLGDALLLAELARGADAFSSAEPQRGEVTYAAKIGVEDVHLDFSRSADLLHRQVRVGRAWTTVRGRRLLIHEARLVKGVGATGTSSSQVESGSVVGDAVMTGDGLLLPLVVQAEGRARVTFSAWLAGARLGPLETLGT